MVDVNIGSPTGDRVIEPTMSLDEGATLAARVADMALQSGNPGKGLDVIKEIFESHVIPEFLEPAIGPTDGPRSV